MCVYNMKILFLIDEKENIDLPMNLESLTSLEDNTFSNRVSFVSKNNDDY